MCNVWVSQLKQWRTAEAENEAMKREKTEREREGEGEQEIIIDKLRDEMIEVVTT